MQLGEQTDQHGELHGLPLVSAVLITRNQRWNVARLVGSVLAELEGVVGAEIVLVDSSSSDGTADEAARFPIRVIRIREGEFVSPAAGRYLGFRDVTGRFVLFLDGDSELYRGWLSRALAFLESHPDVAVVSGRLIGVPIDGETGDMPSVSEAPDDWTEVEHAGGLALYRRKVLDEVGSFNPWLRSDEEPELCLRIRHAGYRVMRSRAPHAFEYTEPKKSTRGAVGRWRRGLYVGSGQCLRLHLGRPTFRTYVAERGFGLIPLGVLVAGVVAGGYSVVRGDVLAIALWFGLVFVGIGAVAVRRRTVRGLAHSVLLRMLFVDGTVRGFIRGVRPVDEYTPKVDVIRAGPDDEDWDHTK